MKLKRAKTGSSCGYLRSVETNDKLDMAEARFLALIFFSFRITQTSVNTDVFGRSPEVRGNEVLLYLATTLTSPSDVKFHITNVPPATEIYRSSSHAHQSVYDTVE